MLRGACIGKLVDGEKRRHCTSALECGSAFTQGVVEHGGFRGARVRGAPDLVSGKHLRGLRALKQEQLHRRYLAVSLDPIRRKTEDGIEIWPWREFLKAIWAGELLPSS